MYRIRSLSLLVLVIIFLTSNGSGINYCGIEVTPFGFVASDLFFDSRQEFAARDNYVNFWPLPVLRDPVGKDINDRGDWGITAIQTRCGIEALWNWRRGRLKGFIEGDFLGVTDQSTGTFRLRHAYAELATERWSLIVGQTWHPLFVLDCFPDTIAFTNGAPMEAFSRDPQVRLTVKGYRTELILAALAERDIPSIGPLGQVTDYSRNALIPNLHCQARIFPHDEVVVGVALDYKRLVPQIESDRGYAVHESLNSIICELYGAYNAPRFQWRTKCIYGQNGASQLLLSGYAIRSRDQVIGAQTYANTQTVTGWIDTAYWFHEESVGLGLFLGYAKNLGSRDTLLIDKRTKQPVVFAISPTIDYVARVAPRIKYRTKLFQFGAELEFTRAAYGILNNKAQVVDPVPVQNVRVLLEALYFF